MKTYESQVINLGFMGILKPVYVATAMTLIAEFFYFIIWGLILFPDGNLSAKAMWTLTCGLAMGVVIGVATLLLVSKREHLKSNILLAATIMFLIGSYCAFLCSKIDMNYNYFGAVENSTLFLMSGIIPSLFGGLLYGWILYRLEA